MSVRTTKSTLALSGALFVALTWAISANAQQPSSDEGGCDGVIARWQTFATEENQGGHMDTSVFDAIETDIGRATTSCQAGHDAEALRLIAASKRRHGY